MIDTILSMDDRDALREMSALTGQYMNEATFRRAWYDVRVEIITRFSPFASAGKMQQLSSVGQSQDAESNPLRVTDQDVWDGYIKGKSGEARIFAGFRLLLYFHGAQKYGRVGTLVTDMLTRIDALDDPFDRLRLTIALGDSLVKDAHFEALIATQSWIDIQPTPATFDIEATEDEFAIPPPVAPNTETTEEKARREVENERRALVRTNRLATIQNMKDGWAMSIANIEAKAAAPETSRDLETAAASETDPKRRLYLLRKAHEASLTE